MISRRSLVTGLAALVAAPAVIREGILMPVRSIILPVGPSLSLTLVDPRAGGLAYPPGSFISLLGVLPSGLINGARYRVMSVSADGQIDLHGPYPDA